jgi:hypothetical protein
MPACLAPGHQHFIITIAIKMNKLNWTKALFYLLVFIVFLGGFFLLKTAANQNHGSNMPSINGVNTGSNFDLKTAVAGIPVNAFMVRFPYTAYVKSNNIQNITSIKEDIKTLEALYPNKEMDIQQTLSLALTDSLKSSYGASFDKFMPDSMIRLFQWAEQFSYYGDYDPQKQLLYQSIFIYWLTYINNKLADYSEVNANLKYDFKYKFLVAKCAEKKSFVPVKVTAVEKVLYNLLGGHWSHLFNASWQQTTLLQKIFLTLVILITIFSYYLLALFVVKKTVKRNPSINKI